MRGQKRVEVCSDTIHGLEAGRKKKKKKNGRGKKAGGGGKKKKKKTVEEKRLEEISCRTQTAAPPRGGQRESPENLERVSREEQRKSETHTTGAGRRPRDARTSVCVCVCGWVGSCATKLTRREKNKKRKLQKWKLQNHFFIMALSLCFCLFYTCIIQRTKTH